MPDNSEAIEQLRAFGASDEAIATLQREQAPEVFEVWPENARAVALFVDCATQWAMVAMVGITGLNYSGVREVMDMRGIPQAERAALFSDLRVMETAALSVLTKG